ncbi:MAG: flagellar protein FliS [Gemmataceae bacterium]|nr:flagellar protein FliS [Gemmata sp.]MDW8197066.1 flagellar protein FliS [Gemmataceae bacterium]
MNPYLKYRQREEPIGWTRIDLLLALYDKALERLDRAETALKAGQTTIATSELAKTQLILTALVSGVRPEVNPDYAGNILRLYEYVSNELRFVKYENIMNARKILRTLREGFDSIRDEANRLERSGQIPAAEEIQMVLATA